MAAGRRTMRRAIVSALVRCAWSPALVLALGGPASAQALPSEPISLADGRLVLSGDVSGSISSEPDSGYLNVGDYEHDELRLLRLGVTAALYPAARISVLAEVRTEGWDQVEPYALFVRVRPWADRSFHVNVGRIPPTFGAFPRRSYGKANLLIGQPLPFHYRTSIQPNAVPATADELLDVRALGGAEFVRYALGAQTSEQGLPLVNVLRWDTGVQVGIGSRPVEVLAAVTTGSLSHPLVADDNGGKQIVGRVTFRPSAALSLGVSGARGAHLDDDLLEVLPDSETESFTQVVVGVDAEYARGAWLLRAEGLASSWRLPAVETPRIDERLRSIGLTLEGQYRIAPGWYVAARLGHLGFSEITGTRFDREPTPWDEPVSRLEVGVGHYFLRNLIAKVAYQQNWRDDPYPSPGGFLAAQLLYWF